jgi:HEAT repeat protein
MSKLEKISKLVQKGKSEKLAALAGNKDPEVRQAAIHALGEIGDERSLNTLVVLIRSDDANDRAEAVRALGELAIRDSRNTAAKTHLQYLKTNEKEPAVIKALEETMNKISDADN